MKNNFYEWVMGQADLLTEPSPGVTLVELAGDRRVLIENHGGVTVYGQKEIRIRGSYGMLCVHGTNLELARMTKQQLIITGCIESVSLFRGAC